jgi:Beta-ketoacyl synthase, N-terminal domain
LQSVVGENMTVLTLYIDAIGLCGPGLDGWAVGQTALRGDMPYVCTPSVIAPSSFLPAAERRRVGVAVKLALATATDALQHSQHNASEMLSVFSSSGGDGDNCHVICEALASEDRLISPTRFTNSVHNAPSGYWGIALQAKPASTSLCAFDGSFSAGFLEACTQAITANAPVLLIAYDTPYPEPLQAARPIAHSLGVALVLNPQSTASSLAKVNVGLGKRTVSKMQNPELEALRRNVPAARGLPLLQAIASGRTDMLLVLELFDNLQLLLEVSTLS